MQINSSARMNDIWIYIYELIQLCLLSCVYTSLFVAEKIDWDVFCFPEEEEMEMAHFVVFYISFVVLCFFDRER